MDLRTGEPTVPGTARHGDVCIGLALGSGGARGWAHIGILRALAEAGIRPDVVCGCSIGSLVGAAYVTGQIDSFASWVKSLTWREIVGLLDPGLSGGGIIRGGRLLRFLRKHYRDIAIEDSPIPFAAVATDLATGNEVWLRNGPLFDAVRASIAVPGLFGPVRMNGSWLVDGGLVNPVPVSLCRAMGANFIVAVTLNADKAYPPADPPATAAVPPFQSNVFDVVATSINIMQDHIARSRLAGDPPHLLLAPSLGHIGVLAFDRAAEAIDEGHRCAVQSLPALRDWMARFATRQPSR
ncbi:patatin-like phospholipase family protein [Shumkonia mesophila]|uniref:patatin-like phospholipase family protein n=1 Tax=Shumkonia mesophila TaxID=2838854 RepID=UPI0029344C95|nr:patatin-like phospholipase family protein [Shumkonia mesophila]